MKINKLLMVGWLILALAFLVNNPEARSDCSDGDPTGGGSTTVSVAKAVHSAGDLIKQYQEYYDIINQYVRETSPEKKKQLLEKAKKMLSRLNEQAENVEAEIAALSQKKLKRAYARKLERVLKRVQTVRASAQNRMQDAVRTG
jgi:hypothetical protein